MGGVQDESTRARSVNVAEAELLAESWRLALRPGRKSPQTLKACSDGVRLHLA
jgi:hypothetical protein